MSKPFNKNAALRDLNAPRGYGKQIGLKSALHTGQVKALKKFFSGNVDTLLIACGRKFGKSEMALYALWRQAVMHSGSACYYVAPTREQAKKLLWDVRRLHDYMPEHYQEGRPNNRDLMIRLKNGSFIQLMGSENYEAANGLSPHLIVYDEFKAFHPSFHRTMGPNRVTHGAKLLVIGTMADGLAINQKEYWGMYKFCKQDASGAVHVATTFDNPINTLPAQKKAIEAEIALLRARGDEDVVQREFYSKIIPGGSRAIFPQFNKEKHVRPHKEIMDSLSRQLSDLVFVNALDPGTARCYAALFMAIDQKTKKVYILDEIYETDQNKTHTSAVFPEVMRKAKELNPYKQLNDWVLIYDEAAKWSAKEIAAQYGVHYMPTMKTVNKKEEGISLIKDAFAHDLIVVSDRCKNFVNEVVSYAKDERGNIPKNDKVEDHVVDCIAEGELVATINGDIPIEDIKIGDIVVTNKGLDIVTDTWSKENADVIKLHFSDGNTIKCTKGHKIFTENRGFIEAQLLTQYDTFNTINVWKKEKSYTTELNLDVTQTQKTKVIGGITDVIHTFIKKVLDIFIAMYIGVKKGLYQTVTKSITSIITLTTTTYQILRQFAPKSILKSIQDIVLKPQKKTWTELGILQKNGTLLKKVENGILKTLKKCGKICLKLKRNVFCAEINIKSIKSWLKNQNTATQTVKLLEIEELGKERVHDLTTKNYSRFYVNGILVHNCTRYGLYAVNYDISEVIQQFIAPKGPRNPSHDPELTNEDLFDFGFDGFDWD